MGGAGGVGAGEGLGAPVEVVEEADGVFGDDDAGGFASFLLYVELVEFLLGTDVVDELGGDADGVF